MSWSSGYGTVGPNGVYLFGVHEIQNDHSQAEDIQGKIYAVVHIVFVVFCVFGMIEFVDFLVLSSANTTELERATK